MRMFRLQPFSMVCCAYQMRSAKFFSLSKIVQLWNHGNCAATCCTKSSSGQASAKALIYLRFRGEKPLISETHCEDPRQADRSLCFPSLIDVAVRECPDRSANIGEQALDLPRGQPSPARFGFVPSNPEGIRRSLPE